MICNRNTLLAYAPIKNMVDGKNNHGGVTHGLGEAGYDIRIKQDVRFKRVKTDRMSFGIREPGDEAWGIGFGRFTLASAIEEFDMPNNLTGIVHDKSSWARRGLSVFNTVIEPGWKGFLTLELVYHGESELIIPAGSGIAQVVFHLNSDTAQYNGRYQHQSDQPVPAIQAE